MISAALDANTVVSGVFTAKGNPARVLDAARDGQFRCISSEAVVAEVARALSSDKARRAYGVTDDDVADVLGFLESDDVLVQISVRVEGVAAHYHDDLILATAVSGKADYLVTGDRQLLALGSFQGVRIVTPRAFLEILGLEPPA